MIHPRITLLHAEVVATMRGISRESVYELVDGAGTDELGAFIWVFNVCAAPRRDRELRFWSRELHEPLSVRDLALAEVIRQIVPKRDMLPGHFNGRPIWQVRDLLRVSRRAMLDLREELGAVPHNGGLFVPQKALEDFFQRRWCFASTVPKQCALFSSTL